MKIYFPEINKKDPRRLLTINDKDAIVSQAHYKEGRSAQLLWDSLFIGETQTLPKAITDFFSNNNTFTQLEILEAIPEHHTAFDNYGKGRMNDLLLKCTSNQGNIAVSIEAKVDEPFDNRLVSDYKLEANAILDTTPNSKRQARINDLIPFVFRTVSDPKIDTILYQLVQAVASAVIEGDQENGLAIFCILNFTPANPTPLYIANRSRNDMELNAFLEIVTDQKLSNLQVGKIEGPFHLPGKSHVPLYFLKLEQSF